MIDVIHEINAIRRQVGSRVLDAGEARTVTVARTFDAELADVWDACTNPERIPRWFVPVTGDLREGGRFQIQGNASGTIQRCNAPHGFDATWEIGDDTTWIEVRLTAESPTRTRLELQHIARVDDERWMQFGPGAVGVGWDMTMLGLAGHLGSAARVDPSEAMAWMASDEGKQFISLSSDGWREANVAFGTDASTAAAAAARTTAAYTGAEEPSSVS